jgi:hypothetical protein
MEGFKEFATNWNDFWNTCKGFFEGCGTVLNFVSDCFTKEGFLIGNLKTIAPGALLIFVSVLIILRVLGFKNSNKWIGLAFVLALIIAGL